MVQRHSTPADEGQVLEGSFFGKNLSGAPYFLTKEGPEVTLIISLLRNVGCVGHFVKAPPRERNC
jgi:hypothetical protein